MESKLTQFASLSQKDKAPAYLSLLPEILSRSNPSSIATDLRLLVNTVVNQESVGIVVGRQVLSELVKSLGGGVIKNAELRKRIVEDTLATVQPRITSYEEQVST
jgi:COP9 signalosome complex subunit 4